MHPTSSASIHLKLFDGARLRFAMGLDPEVWGKPGDGVDFQVRVRLGDKEDVVFSAYVDPKHDATQRRWIDAAVDLSRCAGRDVDLVLATSPHQSADYDWAGWGLPVISR